MRLRGGKKIEIARRAKDKASTARDLGLSRSSLYYSPKMEDKDQELINEINKTHRDNPAYGQKRMALELRVNHKRTERVMKEHGLTPPRRKARGFYTTKSTYDHSYTNLIKEIDMGVITPHYIWVSDLSYIKYQGQFYYLSTIEDVATRRIIGTQIGKHHDSELVMATIRQAMAATSTHPTYFHTDQGKEFMAQGVTEYLEQQGVTISVSDPGSPWQNGYKESFFGRFKEEFGDFDRFDSPGELIEEIYSQVYYYNHKRIHTSLKMSPVAYTQKLLQKVS